MIKLTTTTDKARKQTTVTATDSDLGFLATGTWDGLGVRVAVALAQQVKADAEQVLSRALNARIEQQRAHFAHMACMV